MIANLIEQLETEAAHADEMAALAQYWMSRAQQLEKDLFQTKAMLIASAGGQITVHRRLMHDIEQMTVESVYQPWDDTILFRTKVGIPTSQSSE